MKGVVRRLGIAVCTCRHQWLTRWPPRAQRTVAVLPDIKTPRRILPQNHRPPIHLRVLAIHIPVDFRSHNLFETMSSNQFQEFNIDELTAFINNNTPGDNLGFDEFSWDSSNVVGQSQPGYTGVGVWGDLNSYPDFPSPTSAPTSLYPTHGVFPNEGKSSYILMTIVRRLTLCSQETPPRFTRVWLYPRSRHNWRPLPPSPTTPASPPSHPSQPCHTAVSVVPSSLRHQSLTCHD